MVSAAKNASIWLCHMFWMYFSRAIDSNYYLIFAKFYKGRAVSIFYYANINFYFAKLLRGSTISTLALFVY
jgi:hypothetical protein